MREENSALNRTYLYFYDNAGNLTQKKEYAYTTGSTENATPLDMIFYPDTEYGNQVAIGPVVVNNSGDVLLSLSASAHFFGGGHASIAFNLTEFFERLFD